MLATPEKVELSLLWVQPERLGEILQGALVVSQRPVGLPSAAIGFGLIGVEADSLGVIGDSLAVSALLCVRIATFGVTQRIGGIEADRCGVIGDGPCSCRCCRGCCS